MIKLLSNSVKLFALVYNLKMQVSMTQNSLDQYLSIVKTFMLQTHQRIGDQYQIPPVETHLISIIDQASIKLKTYKEQINILQAQLKEAEISKISQKDMKNEYVHLQKRLNQKCDEISILRETIKTLYRDNERISEQKQSFSKELSSLKESSSSLRKKLKKQEQQINNHKNQLKKLTSITEDKIKQYLKEDAEKQLTIKRIGSELERAKIDLNKKQKLLNSTNKKLQELKILQTQYQKSIRLIQNLKHQNNLLVNQSESIKEKFLQQKGKHLKNIDNLKKEIEDLKQKNEQLKFQNVDLANKYHTSEDKSNNYQNQIIMRTEKLKQKNKQIKVYSQQINKLAKRAEQLSEMSDEVILQNQQLTQKCHGLQQRLEQLHTFQVYYNKLKGDVNNKKSSQLGKLMQSLQKLQSRA